MVDWERGPMDEPSPCKECNGPYIAYAHHPSCSKADPRDQPFQTKFKTKDSIRARARQSLIGK